MKILREVKEIERYLFDQMDTASRLVFEARLLINPLLKARLEYQRKLYSIVRTAARRQVKSEAARIHQELFSDPVNRDFQLKIFHFFQKK